MIASWEGLRVLVTGGSSGIGAALARELARAGAVVGICARRTALLEAVLADCRAHVPACRAWTVDLADLDGLEGFAARVEEELGGIDVLVNNAGRAQHGPAGSTPWPALEGLVRINYLSPVRLTLAVLPGMRARGRGHVVTVSSMAARVCTPGEAAYAASKAALSAWMEAVAAEEGDGPVKFHLVYPALIDLTPGVDGDDELARSSDGATPIPAAVLARVIRRRLEEGAFEIYVPATMAGFVARRAGDVAGAVRFMGELWRTGALPHGPGG
jgi:short-subunit dehydrogenase